MTDLEFPKNPEPQNPYRLKLPIIKKKQLMIGMIIFSIILFIPLMIFIISKFNSQVTIDQPQGIGQNKFIPDAPYVQDQIVVKYKDAYTLDEIMNLKRKLGEIGVISQEKVFDSESPELRNFYLLKFKKGTDIVRIINQLEDFREIELAGPNYIATTQDIPNDPLYKKLWGLEKISMPNAWDLTHGSNKTIVAIIDTGIDYNHPEFTGRNIIKGEDFSTGSCCNKRGVCIGPKARDFDPLDDNGHGTHVAGTIGAVSNNLSGVAGIAWNVSILAIKAMAAPGCAQMTDIVEGIRYAADNGAQVINLSLGTDVSCNNVRVLGYRQAIEYALSAGSVIVAAAGNENSDAQGFTPSSCNGVITVGATDQADSRASFSNWGPGVDLSAPGIEILSTDVGGGYKVRLGTSMASPHVVGVISLLLSLNSSLSAPQIKNCLVSNADPIITDRRIGPRLNAFKTLNACSGITPVLLSPTPSISITPTPVPVVPTSAAILPTGATIKPTPTPIQLYTCRERDDKKTARPGSIKIGDLICEPSK